MSLDHSGSKWENRGVTIVLYRAKRDEHCLRCVDLGIPTPTILAGQDAMLVIHEDMASPCCLDCYRRLEEECQQEEEAQ